MMICDRTLVTFGTQERAPCQNSLVQKCARLSKHLVQKCARLLKTLGTQERAPDKNSLVDNSERSYFSWLRSRAIALLSFSWFTSFAIAAIVEYVKEVTHY